ncbi:MAG: DUF4091 domain-containing protein [Bryobacteraceae bacterium]
MISKSILVFATVILASPLASQDSPHLWPVSDGVRVNPVTGKLFEARPDIHKDYPAGEVRQSNSVWNANSKTVSLKSARNEFSAFQVILETPQPLQGVNVKFAGLTGPQGVRIEGKYAAVFKEWYVQVRQPTSGYERSSLGPGWYPDALMPVRQSELYSGVPFSIPDLYNNIPDQRNQALWVDLFVPFDPKSAPPGRYSGDFEVTWKGGRDSIHVNLDVWNFALPQENHIPGDIWNDSLREMPPGEEMAYYQLARQHRFLPLVYGYRPKLKVDGTNVTLDWTEYDRRLAPYLDGTAFTSAHAYWGPGYGIPVDHMMLPFNNEKHGNPATAWPMAMPAGKRTPKYEAVWKETGRQVRAHLDQDPRWRRVRKIAFLDGLDESYNEESYEKMLYYGRLLHEAMGRDWFSYRVDGGYTRPVMERLSKEVGLWVCHTEDFNIDDANYFRNRGLETWFYGPMIYEQKKNGGCGSNTFLDLDLLVNRGIGWVGWKYHTGWVEWEFDWNAFAVWYEAENFKDRPDRIYNGSGQLIYRGAVQDYREPIPSIRLKAQRRGLQDYEYFWLLAQKTGSRNAVDEQVNRIVYKRPFGPGAMLDTEIWKNNPDAWDEVRLAVGERLNP